MNTWKAIDQHSFKRLFEEQYDELTLKQKALFQKFAVKWWKAKINRSELMGDEEVFVVAQRDDGILYFDDVEYGFNISIVDSEGRIITPGGAQNTLKEAVEEWFPTAEEEKGVGGN